MQTNTKIEDTKVADIFTEDINKLTEHLNIVIEAHNKQLDEIERLNDKLNDIKQRIDKAIEYIENDMPYLEEPDDDYENNHKMIEYDKSILLNILQGEDK